MKALLDTRVAEQSHIISRQAFARYDLSEMMEKCHLDYPVDSEVFQGLFPRPENLILPAQKLFEFARYMYSDDVIWNIKRQWRIPGTIWSLLFLGSGHYCLPKKFAITALGSKVWWKGAWHVPCLEATDFFGRRELVLHPYEDGWCQLYQHLGDAQ